MRAVSKGRRAAEVARRGGWERDQGGERGQGEGSGRASMGMCTGSMGVCMCVCICMSVSMDAGVGMNVDVNVDAGAEGTCTCMNVCARGHSLHVCDGRTGPAARARRTRTARRRRPMTNERTAPRSRAGRVTARSTCHTESAAAGVEEGAVPRFPHSLRRRRTLRRRANLRSNSSARRARARCRTACVILEHLVMSKKSRETAAPLSSSIRSRVAAA